MSQINYQKLSVLVADDFSSFRNTVNGMLLNLGVMHVDMASNGDETIALCEGKSYDVILCDYDLGHGRSGQHVLEELRYKQLINANSLFLMVSAEASRNIVMSAYDCEPNDYLMKPITGRMLEQRINRLLTQRKVFSEVNDALKKEDFDSAMTQLVDMSVATNRYTVMAQKMLGELFLSLGEVNKAEKLYTKALEVRQLDWARLGLARVKQLQGELDTAGQWLDKIVQDNPLYLPAYDVLADNWEKRGDGEQLQSAVEKAVTVSPMSILRQKRLAKVADDNQDVRSALAAMRKTIKLGRLSCHGSSDDAFMFARMAARAVESNVDVPHTVAGEAMEYLHDSQKQNEMSSEQRIQCNLLQGRVHACTGRRDKAQQILNDSFDLSDRGKIQFDTDLDRVGLMLGLNDKEQANELLEKLQRQYSGDQQALQKLDVYLDEPASDANQEVVASINREGIDLYADERYDEALTCFERARKQFPKHAGIHLNIAQALLGKVKAGDYADDLERECSSVFEIVASLVDKKHPQYSRYMRLRRKAVGLKIHIHS